jgi:hypothetical protein
LQVLGFIEIAEMIAEICLITRRQERADENEIGDARAKRANGFVFAVRQEALRSYPLAEHTFHDASLPGVRLDDEDECQFRSLA